jgi:hypothetical protein
MTLVEEMAKKGLVTISYGYKEMRLNDLKFMMN